MSVLQQPLRREVVLRPAAVEKIKTMLEELKQKMFEGLEDAKEQVSRNIFNLLKIDANLLAPPSGALVVSHFQDPASPSSPVPSRHIALVVLICSKLCLNAPD